MENVLLALAVLACPVGMGLMMWFMGRGMRQDRASAEPQGAADVERLRAEHERLGAEIERLESAGDGRGVDREPVER